MTLLDSTDFALSRRCCSMLLLHFPFFDGLDGDADNWYSQMRSKIERLIYLRYTDKAELMSEHAPIISRNDMKKICEKYFSHGTSDSIMRMTALALIGVHQGGDRK